MGIWNRKQCKALRQLHLSSVRGQIPMSMRRAAVKPLCYYQKSGWRDVGQL
jgi:hypothetical protein